MKIVCFDNIRYDLKKIIDNGKNLSIELVSNPLEKDISQKKILSDGNYQYAVLDEFTCSYLEFPVPSPDGLIVNYTLEEFDFFKVKEIAECYKYSYFLIYTEHQLIIILSDCIPIVD